MTTNFSPRDLRVSDADRDRAVSELSEHFQAGRLTSEEFNERSGRALEARTGSDLEALFADLPRAQPSTLPPRPVNPGPGPAPVTPRIARPLLIVPLAIALAVLFGSLVSGHNGSHLAGFVPLIVVALLLVRGLAGRTGRRGGRGGPW